MFWRLKDSALRSHFTHWMRQPGVDEYIDAGRFAGIQNPCVSDVGSLGAFVRNLPEGTTELMCHPGYASRGGNPFSNDERAQETKVLMNTEVIKTIREYGVTLIAYKDL